MKLFGSSSHSKHTGHQSGGAHTAKKKGNVFVRALIIVLVVAAALAIAGYAYWTLRVKPPEVVRPAKNNTPATTITITINAMIIALSDFIFYLHYLIN